jgi:hypothetical protein
MKSFAKGFSIKRLASRTNQRGKKSRKLSFTRDSTVYARWQKILGGFQMRRLTAFRREAQFSTLRIGLENLDHPAPRLSGGSHMGIPMKAISIPL